MRENRTRNYVNLVFGLILIGLGIVFLLGQFLNISFWRFFWPFFIIIPGLLFFVGMVMGGKSAGLLAIPGSITTTFGLVLLYQSVTNHWASWAYVWALIFPTAIGIGLIIHGAWSEQPNFRSQGMGWLRAGIILFVVAGVFFEFIVGISGWRISDIAGSVLLIVIGVYLLLRAGGLQLVRYASPKPDDQTPPSVESTLEPPAINEISE